MSQSFHHSRDRCNLWLSSRTASKEANMKTGLFVSIAAALALMISVPTGANAVGLGKQCGTIVGIQCDAVLFCQSTPGQCNVADAAGITERGPKNYPQNFRPDCRCAGQKHPNHHDRTAAWRSHDHN